MGYLQDVRQRLGSVAHTVGKHAATAGKIALTAAPIRGTSRITYHGPARHLDANMNPTTYTPPPRTTGDMMPW